MIRSIGNLDDQHHIKYPALGDSHPQKGTTAHYIVTKQGSAYQEALYPHLSAAYCKTVQEAEYTIHISPHVGMLSSQVKQSKGNTRNHPGNLPLAM
jgi:hypothetical protein